MSFTINCLATCCGMQLAQAYLRSCPHNSWRHFCRVLLNKCQEEFEAGDQAMAAVDAREKAAAAKVAAGEVGFVGLPVIGITPSWQTCSSWQC